MRYFFLFKVWLISCTLFVFLALMEYFIVLFGIRYDKHWRQAKKIAEQQQQQQQHQAVKASPRHAATTKNIELGVS